MKTVGAKSHAWVKIKDLFNAGLTPDANIMVSKRWAQSFGLVELGNQPKRHKRGRPSKKEVAQRSSGALVLTAR